MHFTQSQFNSLSQTETTVAHSCSAGIQRIKDGSSLDYAAIVTAGTPYTDASFPSSDWIVWTDYNSGDMGWVVPSQTSASRGTTIFSSPVLFDTTTVNSNTLYNNVNQGLSGDCYILSGFSCVANTPTRLTSSILTSTYNSAGIFAVTVYIKGIPTLVTVDDYFPISTAGGYLLFDQRTSTGAMWAVFYEKVWAKVGINYQNINSGWDTYAFDLMLGAPGEIMNMNDVRIGFKGKKSATVAGGNLFNLIHSALTVNNYLVALGTRGSRKECSRNNLVFGHAYSVLSTYTVTDANGNHNLLLIRNPWGTEICKGKSYDAPWNDGDKARWTASNIAQVAQYLKKDDGDFFMEASDVVKNFPQLFIGYYKEPWVNNYLEVLADDGTQKFYSFTTTAAGEAYIGVQTYNDKEYPPNCVDTSYTSGQMSLYKSDGTFVQLLDFYTYLPGMKYMYIASLPIASYVLVIDWSWGVNYVPDFTVRAYGAIGTFTVSSSSSSFIGTVKSQALVLGLAGGDQTTLSTKLSTTGMLTASAVEYGFEQVTTFQKVKTCSYLLITFSVFVDSGTVSTDHGSCSMTGQTATCTCDLAANVKCTYVHAFGTLYQGYPAYSYSYGGCV